MHIEFLVEEASAEVVLRILVPKIISSDHSFEVHTFSGKQDLLTKLPARLKGYRKWIPDDWRIVVLVDRDSDDCIALKHRLENAAQEAGFITKRGAASEGVFRILNRIAIEELEAWFLGDAQALACAFPGVSRNLDRHAKFRNPDAVSGGAWEALEDVLQKAGYYQGGLLKIQAAGRVAPFMEPARNRSHSFGVFCDGLRDLVCQV